MFSTSSEKASPGSVTVLPLGTKLAFSLGTNVIDSKISICISGELVLSPCSTREVSQKEVHNPHEGCQKNCEELK